MKNARVCALRKAPPCARFFIEASAATAAFPLRRRERARQPARPRRAYATQNPHRNAAACKRGRPCVCHRNPHRNAAACKTRSPVRTPPEIRTETPLHAKRGRPCVRHPKSAQKHRCMQNSVARAGDRAAAESAETPANRNARASPEPPAGFCLRRLEKRRAFC